MTVQTRPKAQWIEAALMRYEQPLLRYTTRITGDLESARDVVQDAFLRLCKADRSKVEGHLAAWLYTVCRNRALDIKKKEGRMGQLPDPQMVVDTKAGGPQESAARKEVQDLVLQAIESLPEQQLEAFRLKFQEQLTYREISQVMDKSLGTVSNLISSALGTIRDQLRTRVDLGQEN